MTNASLSDPAPVAPTGALVHPPLVLPPFQQFRQAAAHANGWSDHYGAIQVAAAYAGLTVTPHYFLKGVWAHGCHGPWYDFSPGALCCSAPGAESLPLFVARHDQAEFLRKHGYEKPRAIGLPIVYTPAPQVQRIPGSLLVVPTHTLIGDTFSDRSLFERYAEEIGQIAGGFTRVVVCVHPNCRRNGLWVNEFASRGFEIVYGAQTDDANALIRMRSLFEQFETLTTNGWGSHVAYALAFGARVSIYGTEPARSEADYLRDTSWAVNPQNLKIALSRETKARERAYLQALLVPPAAAVGDMAMGRQLIGADNRVSPAEMAEVLRKLVDPTPQALGPAASLSAQADPAGGGPRRILFVAHEASRTGAPMFLLHFLRWLKRETTQPFEILVRRDGPLSADFAALAPVRNPAWFEQAPERISQYSLIYSNTVCNGLFLGQLPLGQVPVVTHVHELDYGIDASGAQNFAQIMRHTDRYIACAQTVAAQLTRRFGIGPERIRTHYEMFDPRQTDANARQQPAEKVRREFHIPPGALVIAACGTVDQRKGADLFVQLAVRLRRLWRGSRPLRFFWIGKENDAALAQLLRHDLRKAGLHDSFTFTGEQANPHALLALSDIFCLPSREDPFPLAMLEATALGKPLVCFDGSGGAAELCALGGGLAVPFLDVEEMVARCLELLGDDERRHAAGQAAALIVRSRYTPEMVAPALWADLADLLQQPAPAGLRAGRSQSTAEIYASWTPGEAPEPVYVQYSLKRAQAREAARALMRAGRSQEAAHTLVRAMSAASESRNWCVIFESLIEISPELALLDAPKAAVLLEQAEHLLRNVPPNADLARIYQRDLAGAKASLLTATRKKHPRVA